MDIKYIYYVYRPVIAAIYAQPLWVYKIPQNNSNNNKKFTRRIFGLSTSVVKCETKNLWHLRRKDATYGSESNLCLTCTYHSPYFGFYELFKISTLMHSALQ